MAEQLCRIECLPGFDTAHFDALRDLFKQLRSPGVQSAGFTMDKKGHWHAPLSLSRQCPVRAIGNHRVQAGFAPCGVKPRGLDRGQRPFAQARTAIRRSDVHASEPLVGRPVNDRRLVAPTVHVGVFVALHPQEVAGLSQGLDDAGIGVPNR